MSLYDRLVRILRPVIRFFFPVKILGLPSELPEEGLIVCPNHISMLDPLFLAVFLPRNLTFMAKEEIFSWPIVGRIAKGCGVIALSRNGSDAAKLRLAVRELKGGKVICVFPQGTRCRHTLQKEEFKGGAGMIAVLSGAKILPVGIYTKNYKVRLFRRTYLAFGTPEDGTAPEEMGKKEASEFLTEKIYERIASLEEVARKAAK